jgi:hypothetical protein
MIRVAFYTDFSVRARLAVLAISAICVLSTATVAMAGATDKSTTLIKSGICIDHAGLSASVADDGTHKTVIAFIARDMPASSYPSNPEQ